VITTPYFGDGVLRKPPGTLAIHISGMNVGQKDVIWGGDLRLLSVLLSLKFLSCSEEFFRNWLLKFGSVARDVWKQGAWP